MGNSRCIHHAWAIAAALLVAAPAAAQRTELRDGRIPSDDRERLVSIGNPILERYRYRIVHAYQIDEPIELKRIFIPGGSWMIPVGTSKGEKACFVASARDIDTRYNRGCAIDDDNDGKFDRVAKSEMGSAAPLLASVAYHPFEIRAADTGDTFESKIIYLGATSDTLRLSYREFVNDMARPAFTEELTIPIGKQFPMTVTIKDSTFRIIEISGAGLRYSVARQ